MARLILSLFIVFSLSACAGKINNDWLHDLVNSDEQPTVFNFDWQLQGDTELLPLQVFDNGKKVWLQYSDDVVVPAIFANAPNGDRLLSPKREGQFLVLGLIPEKIILRGGLQKAVINKSAATTNLADVQQAQTLADTFNGISPQAIEPKQINPIDTNVSDNIAAVFNLDKNEKNRLINKNNNELAPPLVKEKATKNKLATSSSNTPRLNRIAREYSVSPKDINIRNALKSWSKNSEWTFSDDHWSVDVDIPIAGSASFGDSFQPAVRELLSATELGDRPLQPCFYLNKVLRIVPLAQRCDRTTAATGASL